jgi:hypothetical protein
MGDYIVAAIAGTLFTVGITLLGLGFVAGFIVGRLV